MNMGTLNKSIAPRKQAELDSRTFFYLSLVTYGFCVLLSVISNSGAGKSILPICYCLMFIFSILGFVVSFRKETKRRFRYLNLFVALVTGSIIYLINIDFLGAIG